MKKRRIKKMSELENIEGLMGGVSEDFKKLGIYGDNDSGDDMKTNINDLGLDDLYTKVSSIYNANLKYDEALHMKAYKIIKNYMYKKDKFTNEFEVGDKVLFKAKHEEFKAEVWGVKLNEAGYYDYAIEVDNSWHTLAISKELFPLKKKDNLDVGDEFKAMDSTFEVVTVGKDSIIGTVYFSKSLGMETMYYTIHNKKIDKIIY